MEHVSLHVSSEDAATEAAGDGLGQLAGELRSSLNVILTTTELVAETPLAPEQLGYVTLLRQAGERLSGIMTDLLELSALEAGRCSLAAVEFELARVLDRVRGMLSERMTPPGVELEFSVAGDVSPWLVGDPGRLRRVLLRIAEHLAVVEGRGTVRIAVTAEPGAKPKTLRFTITGEGGEGREGRWSDPDPSWGPARMRLGMMTCRRLLERMGGRLSNETGPSGETVFHLTTRFQPVCQPAEAGPALSIQGVRVMLAEAFPAGRAILRDTLGLEGAVVGQAGSPATLMTELRRGRLKGNPYELLVLDAGFSGDGLRDIVEQLQRDEWLNGMAVLTITSDDVPEDRQWLAAAGIDAYLVRPFGRAELAEAAGQQVARLRRARQAARPESAPAVEIEEPAARGSASPMQTLPEAIRLLIPQFLEGQHAGAAALRNAGQDLDFTAIQRYAQGLSGTAEKFGFDMLVTLGKRLESAAKHGNQRMIRRNVEAIHAHLTAARSTLSRCA